MNNSRLTVLATIAVAAVTILCVFSVAESEGTTIEIGPDEDVNSAIQNAQNGDTISLIGDIVANVVVPDGKTITIDLNGYKITNDISDRTTHTIVVQKGATLTIVDSGGNGAVDNVSHACAAVSNEPGGLVTLNGGTYTRSQENGLSDTDNGGNSYYAIINHGTMTINTGVSVIQEGHYSSLLENGWQDGNVNKDGTPSILTINGGTFSGGLNTIKNDDYGQTTINGGTFSNMTQAAFLNWNVATINGGTFNVVNGNQVILNGYVNESMDRGNLTINGGTFVGDVGVCQMGGSSSMGEVSINGGTFDVDTTVRATDTSPDINVTGGVFTESESIGEYIPDGMDLTDFGGTFVPTLSDPDDAVASLTSNGVMHYFGSFQDAIGAASEGDRVVLMDDDVLTDRVTISSGIKIDLGQQTLEITGTDTFGLVFDAGESTLTNGTIKDHRGFTDAAAISVTGEGTSLTTSSFLLDLEGTSLFVYGIRVYDGATLTLDQGTRIIEDYTTRGSGAAIGVTVYGTDNSDDTPTTLNVNEGSEIDTWVFAISGNGSTYDNTVINIEGGTVHAEYGTAIYHPQDGTLNIRAGEVSGPTGVEIRAGDLVMSGGLVRATNMSFSSIPSSSGTTNQGAGIAVTQYTRTTSVSVDISGGTVEGYYALYQDDVQNLGSLFYFRIHLTVSGDAVLNCIAGETTEGYGAPSAVYSGNKTGFIEAGTFNTDVDESYVSSSSRLQTTSEGVMVVPLTESEGNFEVGGRYFMTLSDAVTAASSRDTITMLRNVDTSSVSLQKNVTLDLGGNELRITGTSTGIGFAFVGSAFTVKNGSIEDARDVSNGGLTLFSWSGANVTIENVEVTIHNPPNESDSNSIAFNVIGATLTLVGTSVNAVATEGADRNSVGVIITGNGKEGSGTLNVENGTTIDVGLFGISGNGSTDPDRGGTAINIVGGTVTARNGWGIYHPQVGALTIGEGSQVSGLTGIEIRSGSLKMTGGTVSSTSTFFDKEEGGNGSGPTINAGAGIAISQHTSNNDISVTITGGIVRGYYAIYEEDLQDESTSNIDMRIESGTFESTVDGGQAVYSADLSGFVLGGSYSDSSAGSYCGDGFVLIGDDDAGYGAVRGTTVRFTLDGEAQEINVPSESDILDLLPDAATGLAIQWTVNGNPLTDGTIVSDDDEIVGITVPDVPSISISGPTTATEGDLVTLRVQIANDGTQNGVRYSYEWSNGDNTESITVSSGGTYAVVVTATYGGVSVEGSDSHRVVFSSSPTNPPVTPGDDDGYVPILPPEIVINQSGGSDDSTVGIAACAAAAVAAAIIVLILVAEYRKR